AEDRQADRVRQGRFYRRVHLVERAAGFNEVGGRFQDLPDYVECGPASDRGRAMLALYLLDVMAERPNAPGDGPLYEPERRENGLPDRAELCRRQGYARWRGVHVQRQDRRAGTDQMA